jgi:hypothetical protein
MFRLLLGSSMMIALCALARSETVEFESALLSKDTKRES